ncbi:MAG TPA: hypothetical protein VE779_08145 [Candidatus Angelobacter sp.]|jgi:hypothetical protein|nr:hypothetical protein [Candidatus Angelobacter sp.]
MAIGDLTAEQQVMFALTIAARVLSEPCPSDAQRELALTEISEARKRIEEAHHA